MKILCNSCLGSHFREDFTKKCIFVEEKIKFIKFEILKKLFSIFLNSSLFCIMVVPHFEMFFFIDISENLKIFWIISVIEFWQH